MKSFAVLFTVGFMGGVVLGGLLGWQKGVTDGQVAGSAKQTPSGANASTPSQFAAGGAATSKLDQGTANAPVEHEAPEAALLAMKKGPWNEDRATTLLSRMSEEELARFIEAASVDNLGDKVALMKNAAYRAWARVNPQAAIAHAEKESSGQERATYMGAAFGEWAARHPQDALGAALKVGNVFQRTQALRGIVGQWAKYDQRGALNFLAQHPELPGANQLIGLALQKDKGSTGPVDYLAQGALLQQYVTGKLQRELLSDFISGWTAKDPAAALAYAKAMTNPQLRTESLENVYREWAGTDLAAALASAETLPAGYARDKSLQGIFQKWMGSDPMAALSHVMNTGSSKLMDQFMDQASNMANRLTREEAGNLISRLPAGEQRERLVGNMVTALADAGDYPRAIDTLKLLANAEARSSALFEVAMQWGDAEPAEVEGWIRQFPASKERDSALSGYLVKLSERDPVAASAWVGAFQDPSSQKGASLNVAYRWLRQSPVEAEAWMTAVGFTSAEKVRAREAAARKSATTFYAGGSFSYSTFSD